MKKRWVFLAGTALSCCALSFDGVPTPQFGTVGEGYTAPSDFDEMMVEWRMFTTMTNECAGTNGARAVRLRANEVSYELYVGDVFELKKAGVVAVDESGQYMSRWPINILAESNVQQTFDPDDYKTDGSPLVAIGAGTVRFRFIPLCDEHAYDPNRDVEITVTVKKER